MTGVPVAVDCGADLPSGLTREEAAVLNAIEEAGEIGSGELKRRTRLRASAIAQALERLEMLGYARSSRRRGAAVYRSKR